ncbi:MAG: acylhydrolase [Muribaculaceae bacterium]|nr:acylhydrolase [Muribaculaceae bacterium]
MKRSLIISMLLLIIAITHAQKDNRDWAQLGRYVYQNEKLEKSPDVVFMGNSITDCWVDTVPEFFSENNYVGRGISGQVSSQMLVRFRQDVINLNPKAVVILAGTNDIAENNGAITNEGIMNNIISMCELAQSHNIVPILCSLLPCDHYYWLKNVNIYPAGRIMQLNKMIKEYAVQKGYEYVDYHSAMTTPNGGLNKEYSRDLIHPNKRGYEIMMPIVKKSIDKVLNN